MTRLKPISTLTHLFTTEFSLPGFPLTLSTIFARLLFTIPPLLIFSLLISVKPARAQHERSSGTAQILATSNTSRPLAPNTCRSFYERLLRTAPDGSRYLKVSVFFGYLNTDQNPLDTGAEERLHLEERLQRPCRTDDPVQTCGYKQIDPISLNSAFVRDVETDEIVSSELDTGAPNPSRTASRPRHAYPVHIELQSVYASKGLQVSADPEHPQNLEQARVWIDRLGLATSTDSATFIVSHSRGGGGPDPFPKRSLPVLLWRSLFSNGLDYLTQRLTPVGQKQIVGIASCQSERYFFEDLQSRVISKRKPPGEVIAVLSKVDTYSSDNLSMIESVVGGLSQGLCPAEIEALYAKGPRDFSPRDVFNFHWSLDDPSRAR